MIRRSTSIILALVIGCAGALTALAAPAWATCSSANRFCAWSGQSYGGSKLIDSAAGAGSRNIYPERKDDIESGKNFTSNKWCGVDEHTFTPDVTIVIWSPGETNPNLNPYNNQIDHFDVVSAGNACAT